MRQFDVTSFAELCTGTGFFFYFDYVLYDINSHAALEPVTCLQHRCVRHSTIHKEQQYETETDMPAFSVKTTGFVIAIEKRNQNSAIIFVHPTVILVT
jgi:hypothetical protein